MQGGSVMYRRVRAPAVLGACVLLVASGCAQHRASSARDKPSDPNAEKDIAVAGALHRLMARAEDETRRPWKDGASAPPPPGIESSVSEPIPAEGREKAVAPLVSVAHSLASERPEGVYAGEPADP